MRLTSFMAGVICALTISAAAVAQTPPAKTAAPAKYSIKTTTLGTLMADPDAKAVLDQDIPQLMKGGQGGDITGQASGMTLVDLRDALQAYAPDLLSDKVLKQIDQDLSKLTPKP